MAMHSSQYQHITNYFYMIYHKIKVLYEQRRGYQLGNWIFSKAGQRTNWYMCMARFQIYALFIYLQHYLNLF